MEGTPELRRVAADLYRQMRPQQPKREPFLVKTRRGRHLLFLVVKFADGDLWSVVRRSQDISDDELCCALVAMEALEMAR